MYIYSNAFSINNDNNKQPNCQQQQQQQQINKVYIKQ